jgi:hypothetical protein
MTQSHTAGDRTPFTYLIGWTQSNKWYYGVKYAKNCHPSDLFTNYFTSSKYVKDYIEQHGIPDVIVVRRIFNDPESARKWEHRVLKKLDVIHKTDWLNEHNGTSPSIASAILGAKKSKNKTPWPADDSRRDVLRKYAIDNKIINRLNAESVRLRSQETNRKRIDAMTPEEHVAMASVMNTPESKAKSIATRKYNFSQLSDVEKNAYFTNQSEKMKIAQEYVQAKNEYIECIKNKKERK